MHIKYDPEKFYMQPYTYFSLIFFQLLCETYSQNTHTHMPYAILVDCLVHRNSAICHCDNKRLPHIPIWHAVCCYCMYACYIYFRSYGRWCAALKATEINVFFKVSWVCRTHLLWPLYPTAYIASQACSDTSMYVTMQIDQNKFVSRRLKTWRDRVVTFANKKKEKMGEKMTKCSDMELNWCTTFAPE